MSRMKKYLGLATLVAVIAALGISSAAFAQTSATPTPTAPTAPTAPRMQRGGGGFGLRSQAALDAAAKALGMTTDQLSAQLWGGKTLADLATEKKVDIAVVQKAVEAALLAEQTAAQATRLAATKTAIQAAVTAGTITQAKADWLLEGLDKGYWGAGQDGGFGFGMKGPEGFGMGPGGPGTERGGRGGHGGFGGPNGAPPIGTAPNSNGTTAPSGSAF